MDARNSRLRFTILSPFQVITMRGSSGHGGDHRGFEVLLAGVPQELVDVLGCHVHGHALLRFGNRQLGAVKSLVLLRNGVEVHVQTVGQLADRHGHAAGTEVVAALDESAGVAAAEQALQLALDGRVALLHLRRRRVPADSTL